MIGERGSVEPRNLFFRMDANVPKNGRDVAG